MKSPSVPLCKGGYRSDSRAIVTLDRVGGDFLLVRFSDLFTAQLDKIGLTFQLDTVHTPGHNLPLGVDRQLGQGL